MRILPYLLYLPQLLPHLHLECYAFDCNLVLYQITLNMPYINLGVLGSPPQSSVAILKGNDISQLWKLLIVE